MSIKPKASICNLQRVMIEVDGLFLLRIREDRDFKTILNDAHFKEALLSASFLESNYE